MSTSFRSDDKGQELIKRYFSKINISVELGDAIGPGQTESILQQIQKAQITLVDITELRPNVMFEMGLSIAIKHLVIPMIDISKKEEHELELEKYPFLGYQGYVKYSQSESMLQEACNKVADHYRRPIHPYQILETSIHSDQRPLRANVSRIRKLFIYSSPSVEDSWSIAYDRIKMKCESRNCQLSSYENSPEIFEQLERYVWCVSRATDVVVDTTGRDGPDLLGCFILGFAYGLKNKRRILRLESEETNWTSTLSMWSTDPEKYMKWRSAKHLVEIFDSIIPYQNIHRRGNR